MPVAEQKARNNKCSNLAQEILLQSPTNSLALLTLAASNQGEGNQQFVNATLTLAHETAAYEGWLAEYRVKFAFDNWQKMSFASKGWIEKDIALLLQGHRTRPFMAQLYIAFPERRAMLLNIAQEQSQRVQHAYLAAIKAGAP
ncbi:hypothetical protein ACFE33_03025 [Falsihalocynthiibacter sp. SS001]|uniref:hypothetical protein n=1 Tax=Falsihalocynthiibacter sp. SS001 TaxID=3349698 RepID=UPI0036D40DAD